MTKKTYSPFKMGGYPQHTGVSPIKKDSQTMDLSVSEDVIAAGLKEKGRYDRIANRVRRKREWKEKITKLSSSSLVTGIAQKVGSALVGKALSKKKKEPTSIISGKQHKIA